MTTFSWGVSASGNAWSYLAYYNSLPPASGYAYYQADTSSDPWAPAVTNFFILPANGGTQFPCMSLPLASPSTDMAVSMRCSQIMPSSGQCTTYIGYADFTTTSSRVLAAYNSYLSQLYLYIRSPAGVETVYYGPAPLQPAYSQGVQESPYFYLKLEAMANGGRMKMWWDKTTEPAGWSLEAHPTSGMVYTNFLAEPEVVNSTNPIAFTFDTFTQSGTVVNCNKLALPPGGYLCQSFVGAGPTYSTAYSFYPGSQKVYLNGALQTTGYTSNYTSVTFSSPNGANDTVIICYQALV